MQPRSVYIGGNYQLLPMFSGFCADFLRKQERPGGRSYHTILCNFSQAGQRRSGASQEVLCQAFFQESVRATPVLRAASATAAATAGTTRGSKGLGTIFRSLHKASNPGTFLHKKSEWIQIFLLHLDFFIALQYLRYTTHNGSQLCFKYHSIQHTPQRCPLDDAFFDECTAVTRTYSKDSR